MNFTTTSRTGYIGMERDSELGLAEHRSLSLSKCAKYDEAIGRFTAPDALWEKYVGWSPYQYSLNNPVMFQDGNGMAVYYNDQGEVLYDDKEKDGLKFLTTKEIIAKATDEYGTISSFDIQINSFLLPNDEVWEYIVEEIIDKIGVGNKKEDGGIYALNENGEMSYEDSNVSFTNNQGDQSIDISKANNYLRERGYVFNNTNIHSHPFNYGTRYPSKADYEEVGKGGLQSGAMIYKEGLFKHSDTYIYFYKGSKSQQLKINRVTLENILGK